ncbi:hypothetical protein PGB90_009437 [Kerria lacca]
MYFTTLLRANGRHFQCRKYRLINSFLCLYILRKNRIMFVVFTEIIIPIEKWNTSSQYTVK